MKRIIFFLWLVFFIFPMPAAADQAGLYLFPKEGEFFLEEPFSVLIKFDGNGEAANVVEGSLSFDSEKLAVASISKKNSVFNFWINDPVFSNFAGTISFGCGAPSLSIFSGTIAEIIFQPKASGQAKVVFSSGAILAADGKGTDLLNSFAGGIYSLKSGKSEVNGEKEEAKAIETSENKAKLPQEEYAEDKKILSPPIIHSTTHPDGNEWYGNSKARLFWQNPSGVLSLKNSLKKDFPAEPDVFYDSPFFEKEIEIFEEGVWHFGLQFKNQAGWSEPSYFKIQIDLKPPEKFEIKIKDKEKKSNIQPVLLLESEDMLSGIDYYEIKIGDQLPILTKQAELKLPPQPFGRHTIKGKVFDKAGNSSLFLTELEIIPLETPVVIEYQKELYPGTPLFIKGSAVPKSTVKIFLSNEKTGALTGEAEIEAAEDGSWSYLDFSIKEKGKYVFFVQSEDKFGGKSHASPKFAVSAVYPVFMSVKGHPVTYLAVAIFTAILVLIFSFLTVFIWKKKEEKTIKKIIRAEEALNKSFYFLKENIEEQISRMDGCKGLSQKEQAVYDSLKESLEISQVYIGDEIENIKKGSLKNKTKKLL